MKKKTNKIYFYIFFSVLVLFFHTLSNASSLKMAYQNGKFDINAQNVPLIEILEGIANRTGIKIMTGVNLDEQISYNFKNVFTEEALKKLLKNHNFAILFRKNNNSIVIDTIEIMGSKNLIYLNKTFSENASNRLQNAEPDRVQNIFNKNWFTKELEDSKNGAKQIQAEANLNSHSQNDPNEIESKQYQGIQIISVKENSIFDKIGIKENDIITDINGMAVTSESKFISLMKSNSDRGVVRIERYNDHDSMNSIYIELKP